MNISIKEDMAALTQQNPDAKPATHCQKLDAIHALVQEIHGALFERGQIVVAGSEAAQAPAAGL